MTRGFHPLLLTALLAGAFWMQLSLGHAANPAPQTPAKPATASSAKRHPPFVGVVQKVDNQAGTLTLNGKDGGRVFHINPETRITKNGQPATLKEAKVGEEAAGTFKDEGGKRYAVSLRLGPKPETPTEPKK